MRYVNLVFCCGLLCAIAPTSVPAPSTIDDYGPLAQEETQHWWCERHPSFAVDEKNLRLRGPIILRKEGCPTFVFQTFEMGAADVKPVVSYIVVIEDENAFRVLTSVEVFYKGSTRAVICNVLGSNRLPLAIIYEVDWFGWDEPEIGVKQTVEVRLATDAGTKTLMFDLSIGRVLRIKTDGDEIVVRQCSFEGPAADKLSDIADGIIAGKTAVDEMCKWWRDSSGTP